MAEIGIIIPAYHAQQLIIQGLQSINLQTISQKIKVIIVNDGDEANSYNFLYNQFPKIDLVIIDNIINQGPGIARNTGIDYIIKQNIPYICFLDADDYYSSIFSIQTLYTNLINNNSDQVFSVIAGQQQDKTINTFLDFDIWLFGKIYKTSIIKQHNIYFPKINSSSNEDVVFNFNYYIYSNNQTQINETTYFWRYNKKSLTRLNAQNYATQSLFYQALGFREALQNYQQLSQSTKNKIKLFAANRLIRLYDGTIEFELQKILIPSENNSINDKEQVFLQGSAQIYRAFSCCNLTIQDYINEFQNCRVFQVPLLSFQEFINIIKSLPKI